MRQLVVSSRMDGMTRPYVQRAQGGIGRAHPPAGTRCRAGGRARGGPARVQRRRRGRQRRGRSLDDLPAFGSRTGLLAALADDALHRAGLADVIAEYPSAGRFVALERSLRASCRMYAADHRVFTRLLMLREVDPEAAEPLARSQGDRAFGMADLSRRLADQGRLRAQVTQERAADVRGSSPASGRSTSCSPVVAWSGRLRRRPHRDGEVDLAGR